MISTVVLAAGRAERMGEDKLLMPLSEKPLLQWVLESALGAALHEIICVIRDWKNFRQKIALVDKRLYWLVNTAADGGQSTSIIAGLWAIDPKSDGVLFLVGDQPMIRSELIHALVQRFENSAALIVAPSFRTRICNPVLIRRELFPELLQLTGDADARTLTEKHRAQTALIEWNDARSFVDIDVREDYERLRRSFKPNL